MRYTFGDCEFDTQLYTLHRTGQPLLRLRPKVFQVLLYLLEARGRVVSKDELCQQLWPNQFISDTVLERTISAVRQAVGDSGRAQQVILTLHGHGYRFVAPVVMSGEPPEHNVVFPAPAPTPEPPECIPTAAGVPCPTCQTVSPIEAAFCATCGAQLRHPCSRCGRDVPPPATFCTACGQALPTAPARGSHSVWATGERKLVTSLCCALADPATLQTRLGIDTLHNQMLLLYEVVQRVVSQYGGMLQSIAHERFLAVFGAPMAQEEHAWQAIMAALEIQRQVALLPESVLPAAEALQVCFGLHTGLVVVGGFGTTPETVPTVVGEIVAIATALQEYAEPGAIVCSEATARLVQGIMQMQAVGTVTVPGQATAISIYHILGRARDRTPRAQQVERALHPFVGRTQELATLQALWTQAQAGRGHVVGLVGEPGIGKSRLLHEFRQRLQEQRALYLAGRCFSYGQMVPYFSMIDLLRQNCGMTDTDPPATLSAKIYRGLKEIGMEPAEWAPYLLHLLGLAAETEATASLTPQILKGRIMETFLHMWLHSGQRAPVLLMLEDLHWIDTSSEECLAALVERLMAMPALLLVTYRPGYRLPWLDRSYVTQLALSRLTAADSLQMVQTALHTAQVPAPLTRQLLQKADGNPFFLEELVQTVVEQDSQATLLTAPDTVQAVLVARIDRLPPQAKGLLQAAAVVGRDIWVSLLQALVPLPEAEFHESLRHLQHVELLHETAFFPEPIYTFHHPLTQEVTYQSLLATTRQQLHAQTAQLLTERFPHLVEQQPELLAHHYTAAGLNSQAVVYWQCASHRALRRAAHAEAIAHLTQGLEVLKALPETPERREHELTLQLLLSAAGVKRPRTMTLEKPLGESSQ